MKDLDGLINEFRSKFDEPTAAFVTDLEATGWLNEGLALLSREAQILKVPYRFTTKAAQTEYALVCEPTDIMSVKIYASGRTINAKRVDEEEIQVGILWQSNFPYKYFTRWYSPQIQNMDTTNQLQLTRVDTKADNRFRTVLGLGPTPSVDGIPVIVNTVLTHPQLEKGSDAVLIPFPFMKAVVHYAVAQAIDKERFPDESDRQFNLWVDWKEKLKEFMSQQKSGAGHPQIKDPYEPDDYNLDPADRVLLP